MRDRWEREAQRIIIYESLSFQWCYGGGDNCAHILSRSESEKCMMTPMQFISSTCASVSSLAKRKYGLEHGENLFQQQFIKNEMLGRCVFSRNGNSLLSLKFVSPLYQMEKHSLETLCHF